MKPEDIGPARGIHRIVAVGLIVLSLVPLLPIYGALKYDGVASVFDWPTPFYWFLAAALLMLGTAARLLLTPERVGATVKFHEDGFTIDVRRFFLGDRSHRLAWRDIEEMRLIEAPRGGDVLSFRLSPERAVEDGLVQPTTTPTAKRAREVTFPIRLSRISISDAVARFAASAELSGVRLVEVSNFDVVVFVRRVWTVEQP